VADLLTNRWSSTCVQMTYVSSSNKKFILKNFF